MKEPPWRWLLLGVLALMVYASLVFGQSRVVTLAIGRVTATEQESQECYIHFAYAFVIFKPDGDTCVLAREQIGKTGTLIFVPDQ